MNRFLTRRNAAIVGGCIFAACMAYVGFGHAASMSLAMTSTGDIIVEDSSLTWMISTGNMTDIPPLACGQEVALAGLTDFGLLTGGARYSSEYGVNNSDLIVTYSNREVSAGGGLYENSLFYHDLFYGVPLGGCGGLPTDSSTELTSNTSGGVTPYQNPYNGLVTAYTRLGGSQLDYRGQGAIFSGAMETPDMFGYQFTASSGGDIYTHIGAYSLTGSTGPGTLGYQNQLSQNMFSFGTPAGVSPVPATQEGMFQWRSFANTVDPVAA